jgi:hypothetical protein
MFTSSVLQVAGAGKSNRNPPTIRKSRGGREREIEFHEPPGSP